MYISGIFEVKSLAIASGTNKEGCFKADVTKDLVFLVELVFLPNVENTIQLMEMLKQNTTFDYY